MGLAQNLPTGVEHAGGDRGVNVRHVARQGRGTVHHRHAGQADIVLERDALAGQFARGGALDIGAHVPGVVRVVLRHLAGAAWVTGRRRQGGDRVQAVVVLPHGFQNVRVLVQQRLGHLQAKAVADLGEFGQGRALNRHGRFLMHENP